MGVKKDKAWRLHSKADDNSSFDLSLKEKIISWGLICSALILLHLLIILVKDKVLL